MPKEVQTILDADNRVAQNELSVNNYYIQKNNESRTPHRLYMLWLTVEIAPPPMFNSLMTE